MSYTQLYGNGIVVVKGKHRFKVGDVVKLKSGIVSGRYNNYGLMSEDDYSPCVSVDLDFINKYKDKPINIIRVWVHTSGALCYDVNIGEKTLLDSMVQPYERKEVLL